MKPYTILSLIGIVFISLIPPIDLFLKNPPTDKWFWMVLIAGFLGVLTLFLRTNWFVRIIAVGGFINCFFSCGAYLSFTTYILLVMSCYFYIICSRIEDWELIFNALKSILILNIVMLFMQITGHDNLLNFGTPALTYHNTDDTRIGIIGQHMQMSSFSVILSSLLMTVSPWVIIFPIIVSILCHSFWGILSSVVGGLLYLGFRNRTLALRLGLVFFILLFGYAIKNDKISQATAVSGRLPVWSKTIHFSNQHPFVGWGIGTYKNIFPQISHTGAIPYAQAHNCWLEFAFEIGYLGLLFYLALFLSTAFRLFGVGAISLFSGLAMIACDMIGHFPTRQIQCIPLIILFFAYCDSCIRRHS